MGMTRNGIYNNLLESEYRVREVDIVYVFSSKFYMSKFLEMREENRNILKYSLYKRFGVELDAPRFYDIILYSKIEKRGFLIYADGECFNCLKSLKLSGVKRIVKK